MDITAYNSFNAQLRFISTTCGIDSNIISNNLHNLCFDETKIETMTELQNYLQSMETFYNLYLDVVNLDDVDLIPLAHVNAAPPFITDDMLVLLKQTAIEALSLKEKIVKKLQNKFLIMQKQYSRIANMQVQTYLTILKAFVFNKHKFRLHSLAFRTKNTLGASDALLVPLAQFEHLYTETNKKLSSLREEKFKELCKNINVQNTFNNITKQLI